MIFQSEKPQDYVLSKLQVSVFWERRQAKRKKERELGGKRERQTEGKKTQKERHFEGKDQIFIVPLEK